ncbi:MAG: hypothetical protein N5P05_000797 [Chroococcopsis gigantea SAG 12.99]|jgi:septation ring formation regulator EzrA|nr:hypothetical protein [Chlorogloea purpurea SAG 13.99]MDV2999191.1 hypothetical protein [Chroococcopsis gigantea SAG 12.99]
MSQTPITVSYDIKELFTNLEKNINARLEKLEEGQQEIKCKVMALTTEVEVIKKDIESMKSDIGEIKGTQSKQLWALIILLGGAILTGIVTTFRIFFIDKI